MRNRRSHRRLSVGLSIKATPPESEQPIPVANEDISWGGARFVASDPDALQGERLRLTFPWINGQSFTVDAEVVRRESHDDGRVTIAVRFASLSRVDQERLEKLLTLLSVQEKQVSDDAAPPIVETLEIHVTDANELRNTLAKIADGRLLLTVFGAYEVDQSIQLSIHGTENSPPIHLRARVFAQEILRMPFSIERELVKLDLKFEHPVEDLKQLADTPPGK